MNRLPFFNRKDGGNGKGNSQPSKEEMEKIVHQKREACLTFGAQLFDMMAPGMTIELVLPLRGQIITPDKPQQFGLLYITKPGYKETLKGELKVRP